jgi:uncharacterized protein
MAREPRSPGALADPAPLGWAAFAAPLFIHSAHHAFGDAAPVFAFVGPAIFYGGLVQLLAAMWLVRTGDTFGALTFASYGAFWPGVATQGFLIGNQVAPADVAPTFAWVFLTFLVFNTWLLLAAARASLMSFLVLLGLEVMEALMVIGFFGGQEAGHGLIAVGGYAGLLGALLAWYAAAATLLRAMGGAAIVPVGGPLWGTSARPAAGRSLQQSRP